MINTGLRQEFDEYVKKTNAVDLDLKEKFEALTVKFQNALTIIKSQSNKIEKLETNLTSTSDNLKILKETRTVVPQLKIEKVHFHYDLSSGHQSIDMFSTGIIKFNSEISSSSHHSYDPKTGLFIAPYDGTFVFIVQFHTHDDNTYVELYRNKISKTRAYMVKGHYHGTTSLITKLTRGQVVEARLKSGKIYGDSKHHTSFQGFEI